MTAKALLNTFFESDVANDLEVIKRFYHKDCIAYWNSSKGFSERDFNAIYEFFKGVTVSYDRMRFQVSHMLQEDDFITVRYTLYACTIEAPDNEIPLAHYSSIIQFKDDQFYRVWEMTQPADKVTLESTSFSEIKI
ncbi:MAG: nuclear transport factor 2 family protein [Flavobacteriaceae bacterium]|jgi:hypothetical protein|nr:nuclear transport factor 2 family protein [Flavobacteriaceae bacterium]